MNKLLNEIAKYKNWNTLKSNLLNNSEKKEKGHIFELLSKYYLLINPIYRTKLKDIWLLKEVPNNIKEYLNLPDNDEGIDLIAQTKDNEYWAIQCKYRTDEDSSIIRDDIATFLDVSNNICKNISHKLVCTTANRQSYKFDKFYDDKISFLLANVWNDLDEDFFSQVNALSSNSIIPLKPYLPKEHQVRAIGNAYSHFEEEKNRRGKLIMACGSGKSLTAYWIAQKLQSKTILIAVPSLALIKQTLEVWTRESIANNIDINWLAVCSDDTISQLDDDIFTATTKELGIDVSTDIDYIVNWLQNKNHNTTIVFTTYQSSKVIAEASRKADITYDFGIMDEAHKTVGLKNSLFSHLLFDENISIEKRLFMTATERRYKGISDDIASMDDIELYGEDFEVLTFREALEAKPPILCDYKIIAMMVTQKEVAELIENNNFVRPENENYTKEIEAEMLASTVALHKAIKKYGIKHTISFHSSIERARFFQSQEGVFRQSFSEYTDLDTFHVSGQTPTAKRNKVLDIFAKSENSLITNARCLTEGVDVPNIDCVLFADPRQSTVDIVQAVGRALRLAKGKEFGYVLVPILIDDENIDIEDIQNKSFQAVISILRALASSDERIIDYFQTMDSETSTNGNDLVNFNIPIGFDIDMQVFNDAIKLSIISKLKKLKWRSFEDAREFVRGLKLEGISEWNLYCKNQLSDREIKPIDIPSSPRYIYSLNGWNGIKDWLGSDYLSFEEARDTVRKLGLKNLSEWNKYCKSELNGYDVKSYNIPSSPRSFYKDNGWSGIKDWLGSDYLSFEEARGFIQKLKLKSSNEWNAYCKSELEDHEEKPYNIPTNPSITYKDSGWNGIKDWLGYKTSDRYLSYEEASRYVQELGIDSRDKWRKFSKEERPNGIPAVPSDIYKDNGWIDWKHFFGTTRYSYEKAKEFVHKLNLYSSKEWKDYCEGKRNELKGLLKNIPPNPKQYYKKDWINWEDWLGNSKYMDYDKAKDFIHTLGLKTSLEWKQYSKGELKGFEPRPNNIPTTPDVVYEDDGWVDFGDWLGTGRKRKGKDTSEHSTWLSYEEARDFVHTLNLKSDAEWKQYIYGELYSLAKKPDNIPNSPYFVYKDSGWIGMNDWLGNDSSTQTKVENALSFGEAREFVRKLGLKNTYEWEDYKKGKFKDLPPIPKNIPRTPKKVYENDGWIGIRDWLGTE